MRLLSFLAAALWVSSLSSCSSSEAKQNKLHEVKPKQFTSVKSNPKPFMVLRAKTKRGTTVLVRLNTSTAQLLANGDLIPVKPFDSEYYMMETRGDMVVQVVDNQYIRK